MKKTEEERQNKEGGEEMRNEEKGTEARNTRRRTREGFENYFSKCFAFHMTRNNLHLHGNAVASLVVFKRHFLPDLTSVYICHQAVFRRQEEPETCAIDLIGLDVYLVFVRRGRPLVGEHRRPRPVVTSGTENGRSGRTGMKIRQD